MTVRVVDNPILEMHRMVAVLATSLQNTFSDRDDGSEAVEVQPSLGKDTVSQSPSKPLVIVGANSKGVTA